MAQTCRTIVCAQAILPVPIGDWDMITGLLSVLALTLVPPTGKGFIAPVQHLPKQAIPIARNEQMPDLLLVRTRTKDVASFAASSPRTRVAALRNATFVNRVAGSGWSLWRLGPKQNAADAVNQINSSGQGLFAQRVNRIYPLLDTPNDSDYGQLETREDFYFTVEGDLPLFTRLWHLDDDFAYGGWSIYPNKWYTALTKPTDGPKVAIIDTGCDMDHPDFRNVGGATSDILNGGQLDWSHSKQFRLGTIYESGSPEDAHGHGTHVAGLALAAGNNGSFNGHGVIGIGYNATGMILRVFDDQGTGTDADAAAAIFYAADNGADIVSLSLGTENYSQIFQDAVTYAFQKGCLVVAAGNEDGGGGGDLGPIYPAACSGVIAVSANGPEYSPATSTYSGYGYYVDLAAPGGDVIYGADFGSMTIQFIWSTAMRNSGTLNQNPILFPPYSLDYAYLAGTSMATPQVSGAAALYYGYNGLKRTDGWSNIKTARALEKSALGVMGAPYGGWEYNQGYGSLNIEGLLLDADTRNSEVGAIEGIVYDNATPVAGVQIKAKAAGSAVTYSTTTLDRGLYRFEALPPGIYTVTTAPFGHIKSKKIEVEAGSDAIGVDYWCGTFTWDDNGPVVPKFELAEPPTANTVKLSHWAYDPETGIDSMVVRIGTTPGGTDVMPDTQLFAKHGPATLSGLVLVGGTTYYLQGIYTNGAGIQTVVNLTFRGELSDHAVSGTLALQDYVGDVTVPTVFVEFKNPSNGQTVESYTLHLNASNQFSIRTKLVGTYDVYLKASHWLRRKLSSVMISSSGAVNLVATLLNGDINKDNAINVLDWNGLSAAWRSTPSSANWNANADLNGDNVVNFLDYNVLSKNWRKLGD